MHNTHIKNVEKERNGGVKISAKDVEPNGAGATRTKSPVQTCY
mgnify:CR=1